MFHKAPSTYVGGVTLNVMDIDRSLQFYKEMIGFQVLNHRSGAVELTADGVTPLLTLYQPEEAQPKQLHTTGLFHFALLLPKRADLGRVLNHLAEKRVPIGSSDHLVSEAIYLNDPDGNGIEIYYDKPSSTWTWQGEQVKMSVDPLDTQAVLEEGRGEAWSELPKNTVMGHIHLQVSELREVETFYTEGLGFVVVNRFGNQALFLSTEGYHHHIGLNTWNSLGGSKPSEKSVGLQSFELIYPSNEKLQETVFNLRKVGAEVVEEGAIVRTEDPSGNRIDLKVAFV